MSSAYQKAGKSWRQYLVAHGALIEDGQILLVGNRWYADEPLVWTLPGGRCEDGEGLAEALVREFREETGLEIAVGPLIYVADARSAVRRLHFLTCAFRVHRLSGEPRVGADPAVRDLRFVPLADLTGYLPSPSLGAPVRHWLADPSGPIRYWSFPEYTQE